MPPAEPGRRRPVEIARCRPFLARTLALVDAPVVVALGRVALESLRAVAPHDLQLRRNVATATRWAGRILVPTYHPGRQSTLHRSHALQDDDWRRLGDLLRRIDPTGDAAARHRCAPTRPAGTLCPHEPRRASVHLVHRAR